MSVWDRWLVRIACLALVGLALAAGAGVLVDWYLWRSQVTRVLNQVTAPAPAAPAGK